MLENISTPAANTIYCLSYDIISKTTDKDEKAKEHSQLKSDLVWEIFVTLKSGLIRSQVSSTIIFESTESFDYWEDILSYFKDRMNFVFTVVNPYANVNGLKYYQFVINEVEDLNSNFHSKIVEPESKAFNKVKDSPYAGKPISKASKK